MMVLRPPSIEDESALRLAHSELAQEGHDGFLLNNFSDDYRNFAAFVQSVSDYWVGKNLSEGHVPSTFLIAEVAGEIVGRVSIRHTLNEFLFNFGGHIGYMVRPEFRRRGYASEMLRQALLVAKELGIEKVLITCNDDNLGSIKVVEGHGGELENKIDEDGGLLRRYWIQND
jgi:predicted acetyltransferase